MDPKLPTVTESALRGLACKCPRCGKGKLYAGFLDLRPNCEACDRDLPPDSEAARICSFECTFCAECAQGRFGGACPNCGGELVRRPIRPAALLERHPPRRERVHGDHAASA